MFHQAHLGAGGQFLPPNASQNSVAGRQYAGELV